jgi:hypothetical protein
MRGTRSQDSQSRGQWLVLPNPGRGFDVQPKASKQDAMGFSQLGCEVFSSPHAIIAFAWQNVSD